MSIPQAAQQAGTSSGRGLDPASFRGGTTIHDWRPEDAEFWAAIGRRVAARNLWCSIPALFLGFTLWMVWSTVVVALPNVGFALTDSQLFWLASLPGLSGATLRIFYSFLVPIVGGRNWTVISTAMLLFPALGLGLAVQNAGTPFWVFVLIALACGCGGGNFASSMANISFFYPKAQKGLALGLNAGLGNLGVSAVQFTAPLVISTGLLGAIAGGSQTWAKDGVSKQVWLQNASFFWIPLMAAMLIACWFLMNNLSTAKASFREQQVIFRRRDTWVMCALYTGTFGSFIGFSAGLALLIKTQFPGVNPLQYAWIGPLVGAGIRPAGGWLADKLGGARVTFWTFLVMIATMPGIVFFLANKAEPWAFPGFLAAFVILFLATGVGNASTFRMVPVMFATIHERLSAGAGPEVKAEEGRSAAKESAAVLGFISAIGAYGAFIVPQLFRVSVTATGNAFGALGVLVAFYFACLALTWALYARRGAKLPC
jgi:NNP family nitrate/nitrite transporter-like MFS transporter